MVDLLSIIFLVFWKDFNHEKENVMGTDCIGSGLFIYPVLQ